MNKNPTCRGISTGLAPLTLHQSCFQLNALMVGEVDVIVNHFIGPFKSLWLVSVDALCFQDAKEIFSQRVVIAISTPWHRRCNAVSFSQVEISLRGVLEPLVAVELQLPATFCFYRLHRKMDSIQYKIDGLAGTGLVSDNASVIQIHGSWTDRERFPWYECKKCLWPTFGLDV